MDRSTVGSVLDVGSGAFRNFRNWPELDAFMIERVEEDESDQPEQRYLTG